ncbi:hypothetical protein ACFYY8_33710 [Streptosporangium sp. NPDC001559]|uniref:hypothetical protein n=1 Tax=Streptosporangium sp. NPDC001559 TaxID=3366187 RepID=UPI0036E5CE54
MTVRTIADTYANLQGALLGLVPLAIAELRGTTFEQRQERVAADADLIATQADEMMFGKGKKATGVLSATALGIAVGAYQPGGVTVLGLHACVHPHPGCPAPGAQRAECCVCDPTCTAHRPDGACLQECGWCANGCADDECCATPVPLFGRIVLLKREMTP